MWLNSTSLPMYPPPKRTRTHTHCESLTHVFSVERSSFAMLCLFDRAFSNCKREKHFPTVTAIHYPTSHHYSNYRENCKGCGLGVHCKLCMEEGNVLSPTCTQYHVPTHLTHNLPTYIKEILKTS